MRKFILIISLFLSISLYAQDDSTKTALLIIDIQDFYFSGGKWELVKPVQAAENAKILLEHFRKTNQLVIHVRHDAQPGRQINELVSPIDNEKVITKQQVNAFNDTDLLDYLKSQNVTDIVLCGMQTHLCLEAATRAAADLGFNCTVIGDACATRDLKFDNKTIKAEDVHYATLSTLKSYAKVMDATSYLGSTVID